MSYEKYNKVIEEAETKLKQIEEQAESYISQFEDVFGKFLNQWATLLVNSAISDSPDVVKSLGKPTIKKIKTKFHQILDSFPKLINHRLKDNSIWLHRGEVPDDLRSESIFHHELKKKFQDNIDEALRELISVIGKLLIEYGLATTKDPSAWRAVSGGNPRYSYGIPSYGMSNSKELEQLKEDYANTVYQYLEAIVSLRKAIAEKKSAEARDLWDQA